MAKPSVTVDETTLLGVRFIRWELGLFIFRSLMSAKNQTLTSK
jgi:hypothetical protein